MSCKEGEDSFLHIFVYTAKVRPLWSETTASSIDCAEKNLSIWTRLTGLSGQTRLWLDGPLWTEERDEGERVGIRQAKGSAQSAIDRLPSGWWGAGKDWSQSNTPAWEDRATDGSWITGGYRVRTHHGRVGHKPLVKRGMSSCRSTWSPDCRSRSSRLSACDPCWTCSWPCCPERVQTDYPDQPFQITWSQPGRQQTKEREYFIWGFFSRLTFAFCCSF